MRKTPPLVVAVGIALMSSGCTDSAKGSEFTLRGQVTSAQAGAQAPSGVEITVEDADGDRQDPGEPDGSGAIQVRVTAGGEFSTGTLEACDLDPNAVTVYWTEATDFDPATTVEGTGFPGNLNGARVDIDGRAFDAADGRETGGCTLVADDVQIEGNAATAAPLPGPTATPTPAPSPTATPTPVETVEIPTASPTASP